MIEKIYDMMTNICQTSVLEIVLEFPLPVSAEAFRQNSRLKEAVPLQIPINSSAVFPIRGASMKACFMAAV